MWHHPHPDAAAVARAYWESASASFAHITKAQATYTSGWRRQWIDPVAKLMQPHSASQPCIVDVGIGAGALGVLLLKEYGYRHYIGVDIAQRQLDAARDNLRAHGFAERPADATAAGAKSFELHLMPANFSHFSECSLLVCQAAMQHFPSRAYTIEWQVASRLKTLSSSPAARC